ncbi:ATP-binding protein [Stenotrophomonas lactitubi]|uniref:ATP-binding protein n=1 Tax=Stenotrophomonas lactitubi TaxID=2045214 RepID=UPI002248B2AC|nr:ATP-binding protein [Stenotrophomonas lactitubi]MCX2895687.1 ATP-binding protein [Stenotrophomonas lactitubi]
MHWFPSLPPLLRGRGSFDDEDCDVSALRRYQHRVLLWGGCLLSLAIVAGAVALVLLHASGFQTRRLEGLQRTHAAVEAHLVAADAAHQRMLNMAEYAWRHRPDSDAATRLAERERYLSGGQRMIVSAGPESAPQMVLGVGTDTWPLARLDRYLTLAHSLSVIRRLSTPQGEPDTAASGFFFDPSHQFLVLGDGLTEQRLLAATGAGHRAGLFQQLQRLSAPSAAAAPGTDSAMQIALVRHPVSAAASIAVRLSAHDKGGAIGTFVTLEPTDRLARVMAVADRGTSFVVTADGRVVAGTADAAGLPLGSALHVLRAGGQGDQSVVAFRQGLRFYQALRVAGTDWLLVNTYCVGDIAQDGKRLYVVAAVLGGGLLLGLWTLLAWLHWRVFGPTLARAARVYQGEQLSRSLIQLSPVGLCLIDRGEARPVLQNELMRHYAAAAERSGIPLYLQLVQLASEHESGTGVFQAPVEFELPVPANDKSPARQLLVGAVGATYQGRSVLLCALRDLSARVELEQQQAQARQAAEAASRAKGTFLATMSHEIRTPLHGILGHLELLGRSSLDEDQQARLRRINQSADSLLQIINDVLDFSRAEAGQLELQAETFEPIALLERVAVLFSPLAEAKGLVMDLSVDAAVPAQVEGAQARIEQVLRNLVSNAVKFTLSGRIALRARVDVKDDALLLQMEVADSGIGLSPSQLERLFQPYVQADASIITRFGGSGLGLSLCRELCLRMGGEIQARSTPAVGSVFTFAVPVERVAGASPRPLAGRSVLLASAAAGWSDELSRRLQAWGAHVQVIEDPALLAQHHVDAATPLVLFERGPGRELPVLGEDGRCVVRVSADGPLRAQRRGVTWRVSCYSGESLLQALLAPALPEQRLLAVGQGLD